MDIELNYKALHFIKTCIKRRRIRWTYHVNMRLKDRSITRETILASVVTYEIIESYPDDKYLPSYLILAFSQDQAVHIQIAADLDDGSIVIVTAYRPSLDKWMSDFKTRRKL